VAHRLNFPEPAPAPRIFARKRQEPPPLSAASCWTEGRLANLPVMISMMLSAEACTDDMFAEIQKVIAKEARRREAALAG
jgi:hypothetical protein